MGSPTDAPSPKAAGPGETCSVSPARHATMERQSTQTPAAKAFPIAVRLGTVCPDGDPANCVERAGPEMRAECRR